MNNVGIIGGTGLTAGELIRIIKNHPFANIDFVYSHSAVGKLVSEFHPDLFNETSLRFTDKINPEVDVVFLALGHGNSKRFLKENNFSDKTKIIDLSQDFRLKNQSEWQSREYIYGLTELNKKKITEAKNIANPGCFATAIQLSLLPLAKHSLLKHPVHIHAITGATGAGKSLTETTSFNWRNNNISVYKSFTHQHLDEIKENISSLQPDFNQEIYFVPMRGDFSRGIFASVYSEVEEDEKTLFNLYKEYYKNDPFTFVSETPVFLKQVVNTNYALIHVAKYKNMLHITTIIDNLLKGAAGQAVENMNLMFGYNQEAGLNFKAIVF